MVSPTGFEASNASLRAGIDLATRHGLAASELAPLDQGTHFVWATRRHVLKFFVPLWAEDAGLETT